MQYINKARNKKKTKLRKIVKINKLSELPKKKMEKEKERERETYMTTYENSTSFSL